WHDSRQPEPVGALRIETSCDRCPAMGRGTRRARAVSEPLLIRPSEAAELLSCSRSRVYQMAQAGELVGVVRLGGSVRIHRPTLETWLEEQAGMRRAAPAPAK